MYGAGSDGSVIRDTERVCRVAAAWSAVAFRKNYILVTIVTGNNNQGGILRIFGNCAKFGLPCFYKEVFR